MLAGRATNDADRRPAPVRRVAGEPADVVLVQPNHRRSSRWIAQTSVGPPLGLAYLAAALERAAWRVRIVDANAEDLDERQIVARILASGARVVGLTASTPSFASCARLAAAVERVAPEVLVILGGPHATALPAESLRAAPEVDVAFQGEGEELLPVLLGRHERGEALSDLPGVAWRSEDGAIRVNPRAPPVRLDTLARPARHLLPMRRYWTPEARAFTGVLATRGCPARCSYCSVPALFGRALRRRAPADVVDEIAECHERFGTRLVGFFDDTFTWDREWVLALAAELRRTGVARRVRWTCLTRADAVDEELLRRMRESGCVRVGVGIESGDATLLQAMCKGITPDDVRRAFAAARAAALETLAFVMLGYPGETDASLARTARLVREVDPGYLQVSFATPYPGTELARRAEREGRLANRDWSRYLFLRAPVLRAPELTTAALVAHKRALERSFFLRPRRLARLARYALREADLVSMTRAAVLGLRALLVPPGAPRADG